MAATLQMAIPNCKLNLKLAENHAASHIIKALECLTFWVKALHHQKLNFLVSWIQTTDLFKPTGTHTIYTNFYNFHDYPQLNGINYCRIKHVAIMWYLQEDDKAKLVEETGLQLKQINNWFINQRKRNWHSNSQSVTSLKSKRKR